MLNSSSRRPSKAKSIDYFDICLSFSTDFENQSECIDPSLLPKSIENVSVTQRASEQTQAGENPFSCDQCEYQGRSSNHLKGHVDRVHAVATWRPSGSGGVGKTKAGKPRIRRNMNCGKCPSCKRSDCRKCRFCKDKPRFGGENRLKQKCIMRRCQNAHK